MIGDKGCPKEKQTCSKVRHFFGPKFRSLIFRPPRTGGSEDSMHCAQRFLDSSHSSAKRSQKGSRVFSNAIYFFKIFFTI